ncbi:MAG: hypothetical protein JWN04_3791 [Myxococcaceae bacterium]|nr:hypothetical protein [Myxococcaceae bacterium]
MAKHAAILSSELSLLGSHDRGRVASAKSGAPLAKCLPQQANGRPQEGERAPLWSHFRAGQLLELSGSSPGKLSTVARLIVRAQAEGEPVVWVAARNDAGFYPPDFALAGIDLTALVVVRVPHEQGPHAMVRASEVLLRSGAFGLLVLDLANARVPRGELAWQARLSGLVRRHDARVVILTSSRREDASLGPLIGLRIEPHAECQIGRDGTRVLLTQRVLKSKLGASTSLSPDVRTLPLGARV